MPEGIKDWRRLFAEGRNSDPARKDVPVSQEPVLESRTKTEGHRVEKIPLEPTVLSPVQLTNTKFLDNPSKRRLVAGDFKRLILDKARPVVLQDSLTLERFDLSKGDKDRNIVADVPEEAFFADETELYARVAQLISLEESGYSGILATGSSMNVFYLKGKKTVVMVHTAISNATRQRVWVSDADSFDAPGHRPETRVFLKNIESKAPIPDET
ncbi:MAG: hypothetical protein AB203_00795 [Parcubacteria bacterium C7867-008]|nr:MAG: hypothetical protein AB203_00795 [Parcubacteria bacterium C7867-008]